MSSVQYSCRVYSIRNSIHSSPQLIFNIFEDSHVLEVIHCTCTIVENRECSHCEGRLFPLQYLQQRSRISLWTWNLCRGSTLILKAVHHDMSFEKATLRAHLFCLHLVHDSCIWQTYGCKYDDST
jgi:hypothetical protein